MPAISKIRFTNVVYENGGKRYNDEIFDFDGHNGALLLENGGGKTVFIQTAMQAIIPHIDMAERKIKDTLSLENAPAHIAIEWILNDKPRRYALTTTSLFIENNQLNSLKYTFDYAAGDSHDIEGLPFSKDQENGAKRPATRGEIGDYYSRMSKQFMNAKTFTTIQDFGKHIENTYKIIPSEWRKVAVINSGEGNVDEFFNKCKTTEQLLNNLLIPVVEEAIEGDNSAKFVETFERQREHFKKNRVLQEKIEQSRLVKERIDEYIDVFAGYEEERTAFIDEKREAKTVANYVTNQIENKVQEIGFNEAAATALSRDWHTYDQKALSYEWLVKQSDLKRLSEEYDRLADQLADKQKAYDAFAQRKQNIELSRLADDVKTTKEQLDTVVQSLASIDEDVSIQDIKALIHENACWIKGHYTYELELIEREQERLKHALQISDTEYDKIREHYDSAVKYEKDLISRKSQLSAKVELLQTEVDRMEEGLFEDEEIKAPALLIERIEDKQTELKKQQLDLEKEKLELQGRLEATEQSLVNNDKSIALLEHQLGEVSDDLKKLEEAKSVLKDKLEKAGYHLYLTGEFYSREESLLSELEEQRELCYNRKERAMLEERKHFGLLDIYGEMSQFSVEPMLGEMVESLRAETSFIATGLSHLQTVREALGMDEKALFDKYPYWTMTAVCSVADEDKVRSYVQDHADRLTSMIAVVTIEGLNRILTSDGNLAMSDKDYMIYPAIWSSNMDSEQFSQWQQSLVEEAQTYQDARKQAEVALQGSDRLLELARDYFGEYSYDLYKNLQAQVEDMKKGIHQLKQAGEEVAAEGSGLAEQLDEISGKLESIVLDKGDLKQVMDRALELKDKDHQLIEADQALQKTEKDYVDAMASLEGLTQKMEDIIEERQKIQDDQIRYQREEDRVRDLEIFTAVEEVEPIGTTTSIEVLREQRHELERRLMGASSNRSDLESRRQQLEDLLKRYEHDYAQRQREADYEIELLEVYYEDEADKLYDTLTEIKISLKKQTSELKTKEKAVTQLSTRCQILKEKCEMAYQGLYEFDVDVAYVENRLKIEKATLQDRDRKLKKEKAQIETYISHLRNVEQELLIKDGAYGFLVESVQPLRLSVDYFEDFDKDPERVVGQLIAALEGQYKASGKAYEKVQLKQEEVMDFCKEEIHDLRLRDTVIKGIHHKEDYSELLVYQEKMTEIIMKIIQVAEDDKRESDLELQTFLSHLLTYIRNVSSELDMIQNKTRIEVDDAVKQIFVFDIPEWEEDEAKLALRDYIDETIEYYEKESLHEDVDEAALRKQVEERLSVKNLLQVVMGEASIKIKCRKVTNDMKINKAPMVWESSNKWSGGEKWSKNMTLFLSILNYLAEKKQHLSAYQKRQRSVILDNPFGKASSDHVLKPVFMIADKLGFQIIALTAHAEGKFISEYFPVVYSCRLRATKDKSKQLMTNERTLNYAYLKEHSPMTIMRMTEVEQLNLFGD